jgi:MFS family permease
MAEPHSDNPRAGFSRETLKESVRLLLQRRFGTFFFATLLSNLGTWAQLIAEPWLLLSLGASSFLIGVDNFALTAPAFLLTLVGGVLADRGDRRRIIAVFQSIQMMCPALLAILLVVNGTVRPWIVIALSAVVGITDALSMPAYQSIVPSIVAREQIGTGIALNAIQFNLSRILGPAIAGILMATLGAVGCFVLNTASYLPFIAVAIWILPRYTTPADQPPFDYRVLFAGLRTVFRDAALRRPLLTVLTTSVFCTPLITFCPVLVRDAFHAGVSSFSTAVTVFGLGGVAGAGLLLGAELGMNRRLIAPLAIAYGGLVALVGASPWLWALLPLLLGSGLAMTGSNIAANSQIQSSAPPTVRGQAVSLYMLAMRGGMAVGSLLTGGLVHVCGIRGALMADGLIAIAIQFAILRWA